MRKGSKISLELRKKLSLAHLGQIPWNKGLTIIDERVRKNIESARKNSRFGFKKGVSNSYRKTPDLICQQCKKVFQNPQHSSRNKYCSSKCYYTWNTGKNNYNWKGGEKNPLRKLRSSAQYKQWHKQVLAHDYWKCIACGSKKKIQADHILSFKDYPDLRLDPTWGQTLCIDCHKFKTFVLEKTGENVADIALGGIAY